MERKNRANSTQYANPWLIEVQQQTLWINPQDAQKRGITHGDMVRIHNSRGICEIPAEVTPRIIPGVVAMQAGAWWQPDENGVDKGGCANVLSSARITALAKEIHIKPCWWRWLKHESVYTLPAGER